MQFRDVVGQERVQRELVQLANGGRLPHALMFLGREGAGGLPLALAFAQYLFCTGEKSADSCGVCPSCQKVSHIEHADLHLTFPVFGAKVISNQYIKEFRTFIKQHPYGSTYDWFQAIDAENKQGNITSEECEKILENLSLKSYEGGYKVQIIWRPEYLGKEGNKLLKLIEEPPLNTILLFVAEDAAAMLQTIVSRTQLIRIPPIATGDIAEALIGNGLADNRNAAQIGQLANGSYTEALHLVDHLSNDLLPQVRDWFNALFTNNGIGLVQFADARAKEGREQQKSFLRYVLELLESAVRASYMPLDKIQIGKEEGSFVSKLALRKIPTDQLGLLVQYITETIYHIERNASAKLLLMALSLRMQQVLRGEVTAHVTR